MHGVDFTGAFLEAFSVPCHVIKQSSEAKRYIVAVFQRFLVAREGFTPCAPKRR